MVTFEARGLVKRYGRRAVLDGADLALGPGETVGIAGGNGAGKSTLLKVLAGFLRPDSGVVNSTVTVGYCPQTSLLYELLTVEEHFRYFAVARRIGECGVANGLDLARRYRFDHCWRERVGTLSGGTQQKLNLALALAGRPGLLLLDEPYSGFDWETYLLFWAHVAELKRSGTSLVIVSHLFYERGGFDRLLQIDSGRLRTVHA